MKTNYDIDKLTRQSPLLEKLENNKIRCFACAHTCIMENNKRGVCAVRFNDNGNLMVPFGYVSGLGTDPVEKKPFYHFLPGEQAVSFGMLGCNFRCEFCQNFTISQIIKDKTLPVPMVEQVTADDIVRFAKRSGSKFITSTYNEPFITVEWAREIFEKAKQENIYCGFVSNGFANEKSLQYISPYLDVCNVDLKSFDDAKYKRIMGASLKPVLDTIIDLKEQNIWLEIITLIIPNFNDSDNEIRQIAKFIAGVSKDIPWHITGFYPAYKWADKKPTSLDALIRAVDIGKSQGLKFIYAGNISGHNWEHTYCPKCNSLLIKRQGFKLLENKLQNEHCFKCKTKIAGVWK